MKESFEAKLGWRTIMKSVNTNGSHTVVIGGSIAGLLAAKVLTGHFDRVTVVERDPLVDNATPRSTD